MAEQQEQARREQILAATEAKGIRFVNLEFTDVVGMAKCVRGCSVFTLFGR